MNILIAGYGNIGKALHSLLGQVKTTTVDSIYICDKELDGITAQEWIKKQGKKIHAVVNLTGQPSEELLSVCQQHHLNYIDTGLDLTENDTRTLATAFQELRESSIDITALVGFGMNPGIIEYIYHCCAPNRPHSAIELEYDTASWIGKNEVFNTWSPLFYFKEAVDYTPYFYKKDNGINYLSYPGIYADVSFSIDGVDRTFNLIPHEEIMTMGRANQYCRSCAFLYQAPRAMQKFVQENHSHVTLSQIKQIPVPKSNLQGEDIIGMLIDDNSSYLQYCFNRTSHSETLSNGTQRINATNWQVACGVYLALELLPLLKKGVYTMTDIAPRFSTEIEKHLRSIHFSLESRKFEKESLRWDDNIMDSLSNRNATRPHQHLPE